MLFQHVQCYSRWYDLVYNHSTHVYDCCCAAVQMFVQVIEHLPQLLHGLLAWLQEHGLKVHRQPVSDKTQYKNTLIKIFSTAANEKDVSKVGWYFYFQFDVWAILRLYFWTHYLRTDSTKTLSALMWIHAMKASLKFTFSHRTRGPCREEMKIRFVSIFGCGTLESRPNRTGRFILLQSTRQN